jgi:diguanylate cyclase (GGDEF)-like protein/PAS domain S-box-containing protein
MNAQFFLKRKVHFAVGVAIAILLAVGALTYRAMVVSSESDVWVGHTHEVLENLQDVAFAIVTVESNTRGFNLTADKSYLETTDANIASAWQHSHNVRTLTNDNPRQQARLTTLEELIARRIDFAIMVRNLRLAGDTEGAKRAVESGQGRSITNALRAVIQEMEAEERFLLAHRIVEAQHRLDEVKVVLALGTVLALLITAIAGWMVESDSYRRTLAEEARDTVEGALFEEKERAEVTLNSIGDAVACTDISGHLTFLNAVAEKMTGWSWQEAAGRRMAEVLQILDSTSREAIPDPMAMAIACDRTINLPSNSILIRKDGFEIPIEDSVAPIHDRQRRVTGAVMVFRDVSAARAAALQISYSAEDDFLTELPNRLLLSDRISQAIAAAPRHNKHVAILFLDLDGFKYINDSLGHTTGDKLLQSVAKRLVDCVRAADTVSRQGGDEFVVLLSEVEHAEDAAITAKRLLETVAAAHSIDGHELHVTTSIGVSIYPEDGLDAETLIKNADTAMYQAKENGRQSYQFFTAAMNIRAVERQSMEESLRRAVERNEFMLHYQPKIDLETGAIAGAEALIRWTHPTRGFVSPAQFIPIAEACGLILPIGRWVLREACKQVRAWEDAGLPLTRIAVNVSALEFQDENFLEGLFAVLRETDVDPKSLELEVTERVFINRADSTASILQALRERGVQVAVDDFGTGYSSLSYLRKFPVDAIKIDQSFVRQIDADGKDTALVIAVIAMAKSLKLRIVAEGVETLEELAFLRAHKCDEAQGYYFSRPVSPLRFAKLLETGISTADWDPSDVSGSRVLERKVRGA